MTDERSWRRPASLVVLLSFMACVPLSNWLIANVGVTCAIDGPCLIPVFPGIWAPSGVLVAGIALVLRDLVQERLGLAWAALAIAVGGVVSALMSAPALAFASVFSFLVAEFVDLIVYTFLRRRGFVRAVLYSSLVGLTLDSLAFVYLAFGRLDYVAGQIIGKSWAVLLILPLLALWRRNETVAHAD